MRDTGRAKQAAPLYEPGGALADDQDCMRFAALLRERVQQKRTSAGTARAYLADAREFAAFLAGQGVDTLGATPAQVRAYLEQLAAARRASTMRRKLASLRGFYGALVAAGLLQQSPVAELRLPQPRRQAARRPPPLPAPALKRLLAAPRNSIKGVRDRAMLVSMACHGLGIGEVCGLDVTDVDLQANALRVVGRGGRVRTVALTAPTAAVFRHWLAARALLKPDTDALFTSLHWTSGRAAPGQRISVRGARQMVASYLTQVGVTQPGVSCQALRATCAALALAGGADLRAVAASLGHASTATTQAYAADAEVIQENPARFLAGLL